MVHFHVFNYFDCIRGLISIHLFIFIIINAFIEPRRRAKFQKGIVDWVLLQSQQDQKQFLSSISVILDEKLMDRQRMKTVQGEEATSDPLIEKEITSNVEVEQDPMNIHEQRSQVKGLIDAAQDKIADPNFAGGVTLGVLIAGLFLLIFQR